MPTSLYDLPPEILYTIADLVQSRPYDPSTVRSCASSCRLLRAIFRPFVWSRLEISELHAGSALRTDTGKGKQRALEGLRHEREKQGPGRATEQPTSECRPGASSTGNNDGVCTADAPPFTRALTLLDDILATSPEIGAYVKDLDVYLPNEDGLGVPRGVSGEGEEGGGESRCLEEWNVRGREAMPEERLFPRIVTRLTNLRKLRVSVGSYQCQRRCPPRSRIDWDVLSPGLRSGFTTLFRGERLEEVYLNCVVIPPRMLFGLRAGTQTGNGAMLGRLKKLELHSYWFLSVKRLQQLEDFDNDRSAFPGMSIGSSLEDSLNAFQATSPLHSTVPTTLPTPTLTSLHLGFCDSEFLRYISVVYPDAFMGLKSLSLNVIEKDLGWCQRFLDVIVAGSPASTSSSTLSTHGLESFDCTIRCNTQASYLGLFTLHALDFSHCSSLRHLSLKYLLISQVTEAVKRAMEVNVATALSACRLGQGPEHETGGVEGIPQRKGVETMHIVVDWSFNGDLILLDAFKDLDRIVEDSYYTSNEGGYGKRKSLNLESFKIEATHSPCPDAGSCRFRREVSSPPPPLKRLPSMSGSLPSPTPGPSPVLSRRPTPLRTSSSPHPHRGVSAHDHTSNEGTLVKFFPFLTTLQGLEDGVDFESRYVLEHRMELGPGIMM